MVVFVNTEREIIVIKLVWHLSIASLHMKDFVMSCIGHVEYVCSLRCSSLNAYTVGLTTTKHHMIAL